MNSLGVQRLMRSKSHRSDFLLAYNLGIGSKGGVEPVMRAVDGAVEGTLHQQHTHLTSISFSNAFNVVDRRGIAEGLRRLPPVSRDGRWAYGCPLIVLGSPGGRHIITSAQGARQEDSMGPLV